MSERYHSVFLPEAYYHVYARSNDGTALFLADENRRFFLLKVDKYLSPIAVVYAYCLMDNHVHFLIRIRSYEELSITLNDTPVDVNRAISQVFRHLFISYSSSFNRYYNRKGNLFQRPFRRVMVDQESYFTALIAYIHCNPTRHLYQDYRLWKWSSYQALVSSKPTKLEREAVLTWFGGHEAFILFHQGYRDSYLDEDFWLE